MAKQTTVVQWKDDRRLMDAATDALELLAKLQITVGVHGRNRGGRPDGMDQVRLATIHEYGIEGMIPERSFIRAGLDDNQREISEVATAALKGVIDGTVAPEWAMEDIGIEMQSGIQQRITDGDKLEPLAESTKDRRMKPASGGTSANAGQFKPLWDSGQLLQAITFSVSKRRAG
jgi:hypothetical protein